MTTEGPLKELVDYAKSLIADGTILDYSLYHMQPWLDCKEAGASSVVIAKEEATARAVSLDLAKRFFALRKVLQYHPISVDEGLDLAVTRPTKELIVLSDAADNTSGGATGDSVVVLRRILERKLDIRAACVVADPEAVDQAIALGEGVTAVFTIGGKLDPARQKPVTFEGTVQKICAPEIVPDSNSLHRLPVSFGKAAILRVRNVDVIVCVYPQLNYEPSQFLGFGLKLEDYDMVLVKSSLAYREHFRRYTSQMYNVDTPGSTTSNLVSLGFQRIPRPMFPFDDIPDDTPMTVYVSH